MAKMHYFDIDIAMEYGVNAALIFQNLVFWIKKNEENGNNFHNGTYWTYNSREQYHELFPYMSLYQINTAFKTLINNRLIITGNFNKNSYDQTLWYALSENGESRVRDSLIDSSESTVGEVNNSEMLYTDVNNNNVTNKTSNNALQSAKVLKKNDIKNFGEFNNVKMSEEEYNKLVSEYGKTIANDFIDCLDRNIASKGRKYKSHYATIKDWIIRAIDEGRLNVKAIKEAEEFEEYSNSIDFSKLTT